MNRPERNTPLRAGRWAAIALTFLTVAGPRTVAAVSTTPFPAAGLEVRVTADEHERVWTYDAGIDVMVLEEDLSPDGSVRSTTVLANGIQIAWLDRSLPEQDDQGFLAVDSGLSWALHHPADFAMRLDRAAARARRDLEVRVRDALEAEERARSKLDGASDASSPHNGLITLLCMKDCWGCYGQEIRLGLTVVGTIAACSTAPATLLTSAGCAGGAAATVYIAINAAPDCAECFKCWLCKSGFEPACLSEDHGGGGGSGDSGTPGGNCPEGTHPGPTTDCGGASPCCCSDEPPHTCAAL